MADENYPADDVADGSADELDAEDLDALEPVEGLAPKSFVPDADTQPALAASIPQPADPEPEPAPEITTDPESDDSIPAPIVATSTPAAVNDRVGYENEINDAARTFGQHAEQAYISAALAGQDITLVVTDRE